MPLTCIAIDDEPPALQLIKHFCSQIEGLQLKAVFDDAIAAKQYLQNNEIDLLLADINMPDITGTDLVRSLFNRPMVIFTTAHKQFAYEGFELEAIDYLLKPFSLDKFRKAIERAEDYHRFKHFKPETTEPDCIYVRSEYQLIRVALNDVEYIEALQDYVKIHLLKERPLLSLMTLKAVQELLPASKFVRIHRSYIVPVHKILSIKNRKLQLQNTALPVGESYLSELRKIVLK